MRITGIEITDFRGIGHLELEFEDARPVVLIGANGTGKSTVLDAVAYGLAHLTMLVHSPQSPDEEFTLTMDDIRNGKSAAHFVWNFAENVRWSSTWAGHEVFDPSVGQLSYIVHSSWKRIPVIVRYPTNRGVLSTPVDTHAIDTAPREHAYLNAVGPRTIDFSGFFEWLRFREDYENESRVNNSDHRDPQIDAVRRAITDFATGYSDLRVRRNPPRLMLLKHSVSGVSADMTSFSSPTANGWRSQ
ncbi:MAG: AAA family ATPase [Capsulimonadaceae bacterium]